MVDARESLRGSSGLDVQSTLGRATFVAVMFLFMAILVVSGPVSGHGSLATGDEHDDPTLGQLLLTPVVVGIVHVVAMAILMVLAYRGRNNRGQVEYAEGKVPKEARDVFDPYIKDGDELSHALRPNRSMYMVSKNLPHFFVLTGLAAFFSVYTYQWLGGTTVIVYTAIHGTAIVMLFVHSVYTWRNTWYGVSAKAVYQSFGSFSPLAIRLPIGDLDGVEVRASRLKGLLDISSLKLTFRAGPEGKASINVMLTAVDAPERIKEVIMDEAKRLKASPV